MEEFQRQQQLMAAQHMHQQAAALQIQQTEAAASAPTTATTTAQLHCRREAVTNLVAEKQNNNASSEDATLPHEPAAAVAAPAAAAVPAPAPPASSQAASPTPAHDPTLPPQAAAAQPAAATEHSYIVEEKQRVVASLREQLGIEADRANNAERKYVDLTSRCEQLQTDARNAASSSADQLRSRPSWSLKLRLKRKQQLQQLHRGSMSRVTRLRLKKGNQSMQPPLRKCSTNRLFYTIEMFNEAERKKQRECG